MELPVDVITMLVFLEDFIHYSSLSRKVRLASCQWGCALMDGQMNRKPEIYMDRKHTHHSQAELPRRRSRIRHKCLSSDV